MEEIKDVTVFLTSCGRPDLLKKSIDTFMQFNTYPIKEYVIIDDSANASMHAKIREICPTWRHIFNEKGIGQVDCIDIGYQSITTPYVFHMEDDWEFKKEDFIDKSIKILEAVPNVLQVWICWGQDVNHHRVTEPEIFSADDVQYKLLVAKTWYGLSWNPGLRRMADYHRVAPFSQYYANDTRPVTREFDPHPTNVEWFCGELYVQLGYRGAILLDEYCHHTGIGRHAMR
jgi:hypothetical protein